MKILSNKEYSHLNSTICEQLDIIKKLQSELKEAKDLKDVLKEITSRVGFPTKTNGDGLNFLVTSAGGYPSYASLECSMPDNVLVYVDDILGGKVIKQEGTRCIVIDKKGEIKIGLTKNPKDKGFEYKLIRE